MAYLTKLRTCDENACGATATVELKDRDNITYGKFCDRHGKHRLAALKLREDKEDEKRLQPSSLVDDSPGARLTAPDATGQP